MSNNSTNNAVTITGSGKITAVINGIVYTIDATHPNYQKALEAIKVYDYDTFVSVVDITAKVKNYIWNTDIKILDGVVYFKGDAIHNTLTKKILDFMQKDLPVTPLFKFMENIFSNPSKRAIDELCGFLEVGNLPYTEDGHFLAYKNVKSDYKDIHSGTFDNSVGSVCEMPRYKVDDDKDRTCSHGLHFCSIDYLPNFSDSNGGHTMILKINPADVVSIPSDYNNTKGRCCKYKVIGEYTDNWREKIGRGESGFNHDLYDEDGNEYDDDDGLGSCSSCNQDLNNENYNGNDDDECDGCLDTNDNGCQEDQCCGGNCHQEESKPTPTPYHNIRDEKGRFIPKNYGLTISEAITNFIKKNSN
jgi:hypothetical protein